MPLWRTPLAWYNLTHNKKRFAIAISGVAFAVVLMFVQWGFRNAMLDSTVELVQHINGDLLLVNKRSYTMTMPEQFARRRLFQAQAVEGVQDVHPLYLEYAAGWLNPKDKKRHSIRAIGVDPYSQVLDFPSLRENAADLKQIDQVLFDRRSKQPSFGIDPASVHPGQEFDVSGRKVHVIGTFDLGTDFGSEGNLLVSEQTFAELFRSQPQPGIPSGGVDLGIVRLRDGADRQAVREKLQRELDEDVDVLTKDEFAKREKHFWEASTPIGFAFTFGMAIGFIVGVVICYQILVTDVADHLPQFATLKAIGYSDRYVIGVVLQEAVLLGTLGFIPGFLLSLVLYHFLSGSTGLPMRALPDRVLLIFSLTLGMCVVSGLIALRKVQTADPAEVF
jgi:putative ABC transport system permease protein